MTGGALGDAELLGHRVADLGLEVDLGVLEIPVGDHDAGVELVRRDLLEPVRQARGLGARADLAGPRRGEVAGALGLLHARARGPADLDDVADRAELHDALDDLVDELGRGEHAAERPVADRERLDLVRGVIGDAAGADEVDVVLDRLGLLAGLVLRRERGLLHLGLEVVQAVLDAVDGLLGLRGALARGLGLLSDLLDPRLQLGLERLLEVVGELLELHDVTFLGRVGGGGQAARPRAFMPSWSDRRVDIVSGSSWSAGGSSRSRVPAGGSVPSRSA
jgi:hypothetical protein